MTFAIPTCISDFKELASIKLQINITCEKNHILMSWCEVKFNLQNLYIFTTIQIENEIRLA